MCQTPKRRFISFGIIVFVWLALDLVTKQYIFHLLPNERDSLLLVEGYLRFTHLKNRGAVWGILQDMNHVLHVFHLIVVPLLFLFFIRSLYRVGFLVGKINSIFVVACGLIMGGATGNLYDRVTFGYVRDFIDVTIPIIDYRWPVFNVADAGITVGAALLAFCILWYPPESSGEDPSADKRERV